MKRWKYSLPALALVSVFGLTAASCGGGGSAHTAETAAATEQQSIADGLKNILRTQPLPRFAYSQIRQTLIEVETSQANTVQTTTFFFNLGVADPISTCPSVGFPIASTTQLSSPAQVTQKTGTQHDYTEVVPQIDPNGVYTGDSSGTYVLCINAQGQPFVQYAEENVHAVTGPAVWNEKSKHIDLTGPPSFTFTKGK